LNDVFFIRSQLLVEQRSVHVEAVRVLLCA
jgi:hypothetical protein